MSGNDAFHDEGYERPEITVRLENDRMLLQPNRTGIALGATSAILYAACALLTAIWPQIAFGIASSLAHSISLSPGGPLTWGSFFYGLVTFTIFGYVTGAVFALVWNMERPATPR